MSEEPESLILQILRDMREKMATKEDITDLRSEMHSLRTDVASDMIGVNAKIDTTRKELGEQIVDLRRAVIEYHTSATESLSANLKLALGGWNKMPDYHK